MAALLHHIARLLAPPTCIGCGIEGTLLCRGCLQHSPRPPWPACFGCRQPNATGSTCTSCRGLVGPHGCTVAFTYDGYAKKLIRRLKYQHQREAAAVLAACLAGLIDGWQFDVVTAAPTAPRRLRIRGYDQAEMMAKSLANKLAMPYRRLLFRRKTTRQVGKTIAIRQRQARDAFIAGHLYGYRRILIVDDVLTTGSTLNECAKCLAKQGARVWVAAAAIKERQ